MKKYAKKILFLALISLPLFGCDNNKDKKTYELKPTSGEVIDKHSAVSSLGVAIKSSVKSDALSILGESSKDLSLSSVEDVHDSINNVDSQKSMSLVANGISIDARASRGSNIQLSLETTATQVHWEANTDEGKTIRNRSGVKLSGFVKDDNVYVDPSNKEFYGLITDIADYLGYGDYRTVITGILSQKYYLSSSDISTIKGILPISQGSGGIVDNLKAFLSDDHIDSMISNLDQRIERWAWLTSYANPNGDTTLYASLDKDEVCALLEELDPPQPGEERESYAEVLKNITIKSLEFSVTFAQAGLKSIGTVFEIHTDQKDIPVTELVTVPVPGTQGVQSDKQIGNKNIHSELKGGFNFTFGHNAPTNPSDKGWTNLMTFLSGYFLE